MDTWVPDSIWEDKNHFNFGTNLDPKLNIIGASSLYC